ncbi:hypothetical protein QE152_g40259 [Popillia japonica]|uniref:Uncharacterized protein n=1 Tax=Popillia japonica TaxID=7064 RepID=A0AAW1HRS1_POPJA
MKLYKQYSATLRFTYVATQCAAVTIHLSFNKAPPHANFFVRNPVFIKATCQGWEPNPVECPPTILLLLVYSSPQPANKVLLFIENYIDSKAETLLIECNIYMKHCSMCEKNCPRKKIVILARRVLELKVHIYAMFKAFYISRFLINFGMIIN